MTPQEWDRIGQAYQAALALKLEDRLPYIQRACGANESLRREVESLLAADGEAGEFLNSGALVDAARELARNEVLSLAGKQLGPYRVLELVGAGGMGEVYRARDARLSRDVAIKVLPGLLAADADRLHRFIREARAIAALNHPNILTIYDTGSYHGAPYLVAELLEGAELRSQLEEGPLEHSRALDYAQQIAHGLAAAHEQGIVHRDLKPENLFVTNDGRVKILDFGLAKLRPSSECMAALPQQSQPGTVLGTAAYMSPEQVRGEESDHRADIFAFGVVLYEMLSGRRSFTGSSAVELMNAVLKEEPPPLEEANPRIHPQLAKIVRRCLEKRRQQRFQSASDLAFDLDMLSEQSGVRELPPAKSFRRPRARYAWMALISAGLLVALWYALAGDPPAPNGAAVTRFQVALPEKAVFIPVVELASLSVSPDGCCLAFVATAEGQRSVWLRRLERSRRKPCPAPPGRFLPSGRRTAASSRISGQADSTRSPSPGARRK